MKKYMILVVLLVLTQLVGVSAAAEAPGIEWQKCFGGSNHDTIWSVQQTSNGGYIVAGYTNSNDGDVSGYHGNYDVWVVKLDSSGEIKWQRSLGGTDRDKGGDIIQTRDGGYILAGYTNSNDGDVSGYPGYPSVWLVKLDSSGEIKWQQFLGRSYCDCGSVVQTSDGGYMVAIFSGVIESGNTYYKSLVVKLDSSGEIKWQRSFGENNNNNNVASCIQQTSDGGYIVVGVGRGGDSDNNSNAWVMKLDSKGNIDWQRSFGGDRLDKARSVQQTSDGGYIVAGYTSNSGNVAKDHNMYAWVVKLDSKGNIDWQRSFGENSNNVASCIQQTSDGGYIVAGSTNISSYDGDISSKLNKKYFWVMKLDGSGNIDWQKSMGGNKYDYGWCVQQTSDGGYAVAGLAWSSDGDVSGNHGGGDAWVVKLKPKTSTPSAELLGIDVSENQGRIDWNQVYNGGYKFAFCRATLGDSKNGRPDNNFLTYMNCAKAAGMYVGAYHIAYPDPFQNKEQFESEAENEANHFLSVAGEYISKGYLRPALDIEQNVAENLGKEHLAMWINKWMNTVKENTGITPILYLSGSSTQDYADESLKNYNLWVAHYTTKSEPTIGGTWDKWDFWQHTEHGVVPGIEGNTEGYVDLDKFNGDLTDLVNNFVIQEPSITTSTQNNVLDVPFYSQKNQDWAQQHLAQNKQYGNVSNSGCALTSTAMVMAYYGATVDGELVNPGTLNIPEDFSGDWIIWGDTNAGVYNGIEETCHTNSNQIEFFTFVNYDNKESVSWTTIDEELEQKHPVIVRVIWGSNNTHFIVFIGSDGSDYIYYDPWDKEETQRSWTKGSETEVAFSTTYSLRGLRVYHGVPPEPATENAPQSSNSDGLDQVDNSGIQTGILEPIIQFFKGLFGM